MGDGDIQYKKFKGFKRLLGDESNPTFGILVDDVSKALHICEPADQNTDWNVSAFTHPTVVIHSATTPATDYLKMYHDATNAYIDGVGATALLLQIAGTTVATFTASGSYAPLQVTTKSATATLTAAESGVILASTDGIYIYLPTFTGNLGLTYQIKQIVAFSAGIKIVSTSGVDGDKEMVATAIYDTVGVVAGTLGWYAFSKIGTWG